MSRVQRIRMRDEEYAKEKEEEEEDDSGYQWVFWKIFLHQHKMMWQKCWFTFPELATPFLRKKQVKNTFGAFFPCPKSSHHHQNRPQSHQTIVTTKTKIITIKSSPPSKQKSSPSSPKPPESEVDQEPADSQAAWNKLEIFWIFVNFVNIWQTARQPDIYICAANEKVKIL